MIRRTPLKARTPLRRKTRLHAEPQEHVEPSSPYCAVCGQPTRTDHHWLLTRGAGGGDMPENLVSLCARCHTVAHGISRDSLGRMLPPLYQQRLKDFKAGRLDVRKKSKWAGFPINVQRGLFE